MPDEMAVQQPAVQREERDAQGVGQASRHEQ